MKARCRRGAATCSEHDNVLAQYSREVVCKNDAGVRRGNVEGDQDEL
jgi:hypothetical protein